MIEAVRLPFTDADSTHPGSSLMPLLAVRLAFAWTQTDNVPTLLGQVNFFLEFDACFFRSREEFEVQPKAARMSG